MTKEANSGGSRGRKKSTSTPDPDNFSTIARKAKAWDGILAKEADFAFKTQAEFGRSKVRFDGSSERGGVSETEIKNRIGACREAYENVGIIGNILDLMVDFGNEPISIFHKSKPIERFFKQWQQKVNLRELSEQILKCLYRDSNVPIQSFTGKISEAEVDRFKRSYSSSKLKDLFGDNAERGSKVIPYRYKVLDVMNISRYGSEMLGDAYWSYQYNKKECQNLGRQIETSDKAKELKKQLGDDAWDILVKDGIVKLDQKSFKMLHYKKDGYRCWANPMMWRIMDDIKFKKLIRDMDVSVAEGVTNALTIVKLGDIKAGLAPSKNKYNKMVQMLKNPSKEKTIVWDDLIQVETVFPPVEKFFSADKYKQVDSDIRSGLGIAEILVNGEGGNYSNSYLSVKTLLERLETGRQILLEFITEQVHLVSKNMGFRTPPIVTINGIGLTSEEAEKKFILELFDRNAVSFETMVNRFGENFDIELERIKSEDKIREELKDDSPFALLRVGKFGPQYPQGPDTLEEVAAPGPEKETPTSQEKNGPKGGSPSGPKKRKKREQPAAPVGEKAAACIIFTKEEVEQAFDVAYEQAKNFVVAKNQYEDGRSLKKEDFEEILDLVSESITEAIIRVKHGEEAEAILETEAPKKLDDCVNSVVKQEVDKYTEKNGRRPSKETMKDITSKAFAICKSTTK